MDSTTAAKSADAASTPPSSTAGDPSRPWGLATRIVFRFAFVWFLLWVLLSVSNLLPLGRLAQLSQWLSTKEQPAITRAGEATSKALEWWQSEVQPSIQDGANWTVLWLAKHQFGKEFAERPSGFGSGDTTCDWIEAYAITLAAAAVALLWTLLCFRCKHHRRLHDGWRVLLRFDLALWLVVYGVIKVIPTQMPAPGLDRLCEPVGEMSPMGMLWTFLGSSPAYQSFSGAAELAAAVLLVTRPTATLGAFATIAVMGNVFVLNMCYDVPVKIFSARLMLQGVALAVPAMPRLWRAVVLHRAVPAQPLGALFPWKWANAVGLVFGVLLVGDSLWTRIQQLRATPQSFAGPSSPFEGVWVMKQFEFGGAPAVGDEDIVWRRLTIGNNFRLALETNGKAFQRYSTQFDPASPSQMTLTKRGFPEWKSILHIEKQGDDILSIHGEFDGQEIWAELRKVATPTYPLMNRGFHWINEFPNNH